MFFIDISTTESLIIRHVCVNNKNYALTIRHIDDLNEHEKEKYCSREDSFIVHIAGEGVNLHAELFIGNDFEWHCTNGAIPIDMTETIGKEIDHHFL